MSARFGGESDDDALETSGRVVAADRFDGSCRVWAGGVADVTVGAVLPLGYVAGDGNNPGQPACPRCGSAHERADHVDVRGDAQLEPSVVQQHDPVGTSLAEHDDYCHDGDLARQHPAYGDQHAGNVLVTARLHGDVREQWHCAGHPD